MGLLLQPIRSVMLSSGNLQATPSTTSAGTSIAANASIHTKGLWTQLIASTTYDSYGFWLCANNSLSAGADTSQLLDIGVGANPNEVAILPNYLAGSRGAGGWTKFVFIPLFIPRGTRVSARNQALISADTVHVLVMPVYGSSRPTQRIYTGCDAYGVDTADSGGTAHTPGNTGAESTDANVGTTLTRDYKAVLPALQFPGTTAGNDAFHWEITDGTNTFAEWVNSTGSSETVDVLQPNVPLEFPLKAGTQLMVQAESNTTGTLHDVAFYCFY
jgi:hypothetical protein